MERLKTIMGYRGRIIRNKEPRFSKVFAIYKLVLDLSLCSTFLPANSLCFLRENVYHLEIILMKKGVYKCIIIIVYKKSIRYL